MPTFVWANKVPESSRYYLTPGKRYPTDDGGDACVCREAAVDILAVVRQRMTPPAPTETEGA